MLIVGKKTSLNLDRAQWSENDGQYKPKKETGPICPSIWPGLVAFFLPFFSSCGRCFPRPALTHSHNQNLSFSSRFQGSIIGYSVCIERPHLHFELSRFAWVSSPILTLVPLIQQYACVFLLLEVWFHYWNMGFPHMVRCFSWFVAVWFSYVDSFTLMQNVRFCIVR